MPIEEKFFNQKLDEIRNNRIQDVSFYDKGKGTPLQFEQLMEALKSNRSLQKLSLKGFDLFESEMRLFSQVTPYLPSLQSLALGGHDSPSHNNINTVGGMRYFVEAAKCLPSLKTLAISNLLNPEEMRYFPEAARHLHNLNFLMISHIPSTMRYLAEAAKYLSSLDSLSISAGRTYGFEDMHFLPEVAKQFPAMKQLYLYGKLDQVNLRYVAIAAHDMPSLYSLSLTLTPGPQVEKYLTDIIFACPHLYMDNMDEYQKVVDNATAKRRQRKDEVTSRAQTPPGPIVALLQPESTVTFGGSNLPATITERMTAARMIATDQVADFNALLRNFDQKIADLIQQQKRVQGQIGNKEAELARAPWRNRELEAKIVDHQLQIEYGEKRVKVENRRHAIASTVEPIATTTAWAGLAALAGVSIDMVTGGLVTGGIILGRMIQNYTQAKVRSTAYEGRLSQEKAYNEAVIKLLQEHKVDTSKCEQDIQLLGSSFKALVESTDMQILLKDQKSMERLVRGVLIQRIVESGFNNASVLEDEFVSKGNFKDIDEWLATFKTDPKLYLSLAYFLLGHADTNDMHIILEGANAVDPAHSSPQLAILHEYVETVIKPDIDHYFSRASMVDVIDDLELLDYEDIKLHYTDTALATGTEKVHQMLDPQNRVALMGIMADQFEGSHLGNYDIRRMFKFYLHRHGVEELRETEIEDGRISYKGDGFADKAVSVLPDAEVRKFSDRVKTAYRYRKDEQPKLGDLFLRICGYEYYLPQAVKTSESNNKFEHNPEAPVAYPMVNAVVGDFIQRMVGGGIETYLEKIGDKLDSVIAQSFIDFFAELGRKHNKQFLKEREGLHDAWKHDQYATRFTTMGRRIKEDALQHYDMFLNIYARNLEKTLQVALKDDVPIIREQIEAVREIEEGKLAPDIVLPGSNEARRKAWEQDRRGENMSERWLFFTILDREVTLSGV